MGHNLSKTKEGKVTFAAVVDSDETVEKKKKHNAKVKKLIEEETDEKEVERLKKDFKVINEKPWHGLGQYVEKAMTTKEAIELGGLDWEVTKENLLIPKYNIEVPDRFSIVRKDTAAYLGTVGLGYEIVQNIEVFEFFDAVMKMENAPIFETCGALGDGQRIFITAKLPNYIKVQLGDKKKVDAIEKYLFLTSSHDGSGAIICAFTPIRIVCNNTLHLALKNMDNVVRIKHTKNAKANLQIAASIMGMVDNVSNELEDVFNKMARTKISDEALHEFVIAVMSPQDKIIPKADFDNFYSKKTINLAEDIMQYIATNDSQQLETTKGKVFGAYQGITGYYQNVKEYSDQESKFETLIVDSNSVFKKKAEKAFNFALSLM